MLLGAGSIIATYKIHRNPTFTGSGSRNSVFWLHMRNEQRGRSFSIRPVRRKGFAEGLTPKLPALGQEFPENALLRKRPNFIAMWAGQRQRELRDPTREAPLLALPWWYLRKVKIDKYGVKMGLARKEDQRVGAPSLTLVFSSERVRNRD